RRLVHGERGRPGRRAAATPAGSAGLVATRPVAARCSAGAVHLPAAGADRVDRGVHRRVAAGAAGRRGRGDRGGMPAGRPPRRGAALRARGGTALGPVRWSPWGARPTASACPPGRGGAARSLASRPLLKG